MLDKLFGSKTRVGVLDVFLKNPERKFYAQEVIRAAELDSANTLRELRRLAEIGLLKTSKEGGRQYYSLNQSSDLAGGLASIFSTGSQEHLRVSKGLPQDAGELLGGKEWYHQRFDSVPLFIAVIAEAELRRENRKPARTEADVRVCFFGGGTGDWYLDMEDIRRGAAIIEKLALRDRNFSKKLLAEWSKDEKRFEDFFWEDFPKTDLGAMPASELAAFWEEYYEMAVRRLTSSAIIDHFALGTDEKIQDLLRKEVYGQPAGKSLSNSEFGQIFAALTAPVHQSFIGEAHIDLLKIGTGKSKEKLSSYQSRYFWLANNYADAYVLPEKYFQEELDSWAHKEDLKEELQRLQGAPGANKRKKAALMRKYKISDEIRSLIRVSENLSWWQDERKKATFLNTHMATEALKAVAGLSGYKLEELKYCLPSEVASILLDGAPSRAELQARRRGCAMVATRDGYSVATGKAVEKLKKIMFGEETLDEVEDVRGLPACLGRAVGTVKVVESAREISKVQKGDILVAVMTRPDYVPAMRRAAAIVTNEGGITSHAAIVSRELGIPCIIGTKVATKVFHDGDQIEVNANHGWARRIK